MTEKSPAFQFYPKDWISDINVLGMPRQVEGDYIRLLCICWLEGSIPVDFEHLLKGGAPVVEAELIMLERCFIPHPDDETTLTNPRLKKETKNQKAWSKKSSDGGKKSAKLRKEKALAGAGVVEPPLEPKSNTSSSSSSSSSSSNKSLKPIDQNDGEKKEEPQKTDWGSRDNFELAWDAYPEKKGKEKAFLHFKAQIKTEKDFLDFGRAIVNYIQDVAIQRNNGHPDLMWQHGKTFFNKSWKDYIDYKPPPKKTADGIPGQRDLQKDELKAQIHLQMEFVQGEVAEGKCNFGELMAFTWLHMAVGKIIMEFEQRFGEDPLNKQQREFYNDLAAEYKLQDEKILGEQ